MAAVRLTKLQRKTGRPRKSKTSETKSQNGSRPEADPIWGAKVEEICARYSGDDFYVRESIPENMLASASSSYPLPGSGSPEVLIDCTVLRTAEQGVLIGVDGVSWRSDSTAKALYWSEIPSSSISAKDTYRIILGEGETMYLGGSALGRDRLDKAVQLLRELAEAYEQLAPNVSMDEVQRSTSTKRATKN